MKTKHFVSFVSSTVVILLAAACGEDEQEDSLAFDREYCDLQGTCCTKQGKAFDAETCRTLLAFGSASAFQKSEADACLAGLRAAQSSATFCSDYGGEAVSNHCNAVYGGGGAGSIQPGGACKRDSECAKVPNADVTCAFGPSGADFCQAQVRAKAGEACSGDRRNNSLFGGASTLSDSKEPTTGICWEDDGLHCDDTKKCKAAAKVGDPCTYGDQYACEEGSFCGGGQDSHTACKLNPKIGEECLSQRCEKGAHCEYQSSKCVADVPAGGACTDSSVCGDFGSCSEAGKCAAGGGGLTLFCK